MLAQHERTPSRGTTRATSIAWRTRIGGLSVKGSATMSRSHRCASSDTASVVRGSNSRNARRRGGVEMQDLGQLPQERPGLPPVRAARRRRSWPVHLRLVELLHMGDEASALHRRTGSRPGSHRATPHSARACARVERPVDLRAVHALREVPQLIGLPQPRWVEVAAPLWYFHPETPMRSSDMPGSFPPSVWQGEEAPVLAHGADCPAG